MSPNIGNKEIFAQNLSRYMNERGIDRNTLCEKLDFKYSTLCEWLSARKYPRIDSIEKMANYFGIQKSDLIESHTFKDSEQSNISEIIPQDNIYKIPVYETVSAGFGAYASSDILEYIPMVIDNPYDAKDTIGIRVRGDSMYPKIEDGDIIVVRKQDSVDSGSIAVLLLDDDEGLVKKVVYGDTWIELHSINPEYKTRRFENEDVLRLRVVGLVKQVIKML